MNPPRLLIDYLEWRGLHWWQRAWRRLTGRTVFSNEITLTIRRKPDAE